MILVDHLLSFLDPLALYAVLGGSALVGWARAARGEPAAAFAALKPLFTADPQADADVARRATHRIAAVAEVRGIAFVERAATAGRFLASAAA